MKKNPNNSRGMGLEATRGVKRNGLGQRGVENESVDAALVRREGRVVEAPVEEVVVGCVPVPIGGREVESDLHPMALGLVVAELGWGPLAGVGAERNHGPHEEREETDGRGCGERRRGGKRPWEMGRWRWGGTVAPALLLHHCRSSTRKLFFGISQRKKKK